LTRLLRYLTHPQVRIDPAVPVPRWGLNDVGAVRAQTIATSRKFASTKLIVSSDETKALETAQPIATRLGLEVIVDEHARENDRSATGFLPPPEFEEVANQFFANPEHSIRGWERAIDAQSRIVKVCERAVARQSSGDILLVGHGGVGTLLFCHLSKIKISRQTDQPPGGGNLWTYDLDAQAMLHKWMAIEEFLRD
jgi:broad specificity phosphatase PhoE